MSVLDERGMQVHDVSPDNTRDELVGLISSAVRKHIAEELDRPELLNRLGDNIVVFDFIGRSAAQEIFDLLLQRILTLVEKERKVKLTIAPEARETLLRVATADITFGGRGIGSILETALINPLARAVRTGAPSGVRAVHHRRHTRGDRLAGDPAMTPKEPANPLETRLEQVSPAAPPSEGALRTRLESPPRLAGRAAPAEVLTVLPKQLASASGS
ncbi:hypothetical protein SALBM135S_09630 [Streptomyces alboniger]